MITLNELKIGDTLYEYGYGLELITKVITTPISTDIEINNKLYKQWSWKSMVQNSNAIVDYVITEGMEHYGPKLYDYPAYSKTQYGIMRY